MHTYYIRQGSGHYLIDIVNSFLNHTFTDKLNYLKYIDFVLMEYFMYIVSFR